MDNIVVIENKSVFFAYLPLPPSSNNQYFLARRGNKTYHIPSDELKAFQRKMNQYPLQSPNLFSMAKRKIQNWVADGLQLEIRSTFFFNYEKLFTLKGKPKKLDVSNRLKACHDSFCKILEIDDSLFFKVYAEKAICHTDLENMVWTEILPI